ncbi:hypothetical protein AB0J52_07915 [Spirillospora sp. NPDC049652]
MSSQQVSPLLALEYEQLKEEQRARIGTRDNLVYATLGALALIVGAVVQTGSPLLLLLVPLVCVTLGWTFLANDDRITAIGAYVREVLGPELTRLSAAEVELFAWERRHREDAGRPLRKLWQISVNLLLFCLTACAALVIVWSSQSVPMTMHLLAGAETVAVGALALRIVTTVR